MEEEEKQKETKEDYLDLTKSIQEEKPIELLEQKELFKPIEQEIIKSPIPKEKKQYFKGHEKKYGFIFFALFFLVLISLGLSAYVIYDTHHLKSYLDNPKVIYSGDWDCFTERCVKYMTLNEWSKDNCNADLTECKINYQGQDITLPFEQINLPPEHELLCKKYICSTEIPIRRYSE